MRRRVNITVISLVLIIILGWFLDYGSLYLLIPVMVVYSAILIVAASNIGLNYFIKSFCSGTTDKKEIAISFDDGPHPENTNKLLEIFKEYKIPATFFVVGENVAKYPSLINQIFEEGHIIGNHTYYHSKFFDLFSSYRMINEIKCTNNDIYKTTGKKPLLFRPPYGVTNPLLLKALNRTKMQSIGWSLRSFDTVKKEEDVIKKLISNTKAGDIVLFHDTVPDIVSIISSYIDWLNKNGYKVVSLTQLLKIPAYEV